MSDLNYVPRQQQNVIAVQQRFRVNLHFLPIAQDHDLFRVSRTEISGCDNGSCQRQIGGPRYHIILHFTHEGDGGTSALGLLHSFQSLLLSGQESCPRLRLRRSLGDTTGENQGRHGRAQKACQEEPGYPATAAGRGEPLDYVQLVSGRRAHTQKCPSIPIRYQGTPDTREPTASTMLDSFASN